MRVKFIGVGEAFDENYTNTSLLVRTERDGKSVAVLMDCGFTAPPGVWRDCPDPDGLDAVWISHFHGDHFFGLPALLTRYWETKRAKPLIIVSQEGVEEVVAQALRLAYPAILEKLPFDLRFETLEPGTSADIAGLAWKSALNGHGQRDLAVRLSDGEKTVFYSGDGRATEETLSLASGSDLIAHEAFLLDRDMPGHGSIMQSIDFAARAKARMLALVHIARHERRERRKQILQALDSVTGLRAFMPEPGFEVEL
ncbi:MAG: MBL fold metallo-hydrolase [Desulfobacteraceae bacterium]|nr:MBL fold metallo-hydrolase [Desulfobacteraceae bacterium]